MIIECVKLNFNYDDQNQSIDSKKTICLYNESGRTKKKFFCFFGRITLIGVCVCYGLAF